jgi:adenine-specific DNA-methyltransferase
VKANYGKKLRAFLLKYQLEEIVDFGELPVFEEASTFPAIYFFQKRPKERDVRFTQVDTLKFESLKGLINETSVYLSDESFGEDFWSLGNSKVNLLLAKMKEVGTPLGEYVNGELYRGVLTGFNKAFIIDEAKKDELIEKDPRSAEIIFPFAIGDDVRFYHIRDKNRYIIFTRRGIEIDEYPAIRAHLEKFKANLMPGAPGGRKPGSYTWYEIQDTVAYYEAFEKPKIVYPDIAKESRFVMSPDTMYFGNTCYFIPTDDMALLAILNSKAIWFYFSQIASVLGNASKGGRLRWFTQDVLKLPIPSIGNRRKDLEDLATQIHILKMADSNADTAELENRIDELVYVLYGLTEEEVGVVGAR